MERPPQKEAFTGLNTDSGTKKEEGGGGGGVFQMLALWPRYISLILRTCIACHVGMQCMFPVSMKYTLALGHE